MNKVLMAVGAIAILLAFYIQQFCMWIAAVTLLAGNAVFWLAFFRVLREGCE